MAMFSYAPAFGVVPSAVLEDLDSVWEALLSSPEVGSKEGSCIRGAVFVAGAQAPTRLNVERVWGALFDLDEGVVPSWDQIAQALEGHRYVGWHTYNSRAGDPRLRVFIPFARPVWPTEFRFVWEQINQMLGGIGAAGQHNTDRLGYLPRIDASREAEARAHYHYTIRGDISQRLDPYRRFGNPTNELAADGQPIYAFPQGEVRQLTFTSYDAVETVPEPDRSRWYDDAAAKDMARAYFRNVGPGIVPGGRHLELFKIGCKLWWDFWLDRDAVAELLAEINRRFPEPKSAYEVQREVEASFSRTRGSSAVVQTDQDGLAKEPGCRRMRPPQATRGELRQIAEIEKRSNDYARREVGVWLLRIFPKANGHVDQIDSVDTRDLAIRRTARFLAEKLPSNDPQDLADLFADTIATCAAAAPWAMDVDQVRNIIENAQREAADRRQRNQEEQDAARAQRIRIATNLARNTEYTEDEVQAFADAHGTSLQQWQNQWVVVLGRNHYIFVNGEYKHPVDSDNFVNRALIDLSPVPGVNLYRFNRQGDPVVLNRQQVVEHYGTVARRGLVDLTAQRSTYDLTTETFVEAPCPLRKDLEPQRIPVVEDWFATFPDPRFLQWLSYATDLDLPLPALYLCGQRNSGKTLLGHALARLYRKDRSLVSLDAYFEGFNEQILENPFLVADEVLPKQLTSKRGSEVFRQLIVAQSHALKRKHLKSLHMTGYFRLLLLANNDRMLPTGTGFMTENDSAAVAERILFIDLDRGPATYLAKLSPADRDKFISQDLVAKHVLWLAQHKGARGHGRFVVEGSTSDMTRRIDYDGARGDILHWCYNGVTEEGGADGFNIVKPEEDFPIFINTDDGGLHIGVNMNFVQSTWKNLLGSDKRTPTMSWLRDATNTISFSRLRIRHNKKQARFAVINTKHVVEWAEWAGVDHEGFVEKLQELAVKARDKDQLNEFSPRGHLRVVQGGAA